MAKFEILILFARVRWEKIKFQFWSFDLSVYFSIFLFNMPPIQLRALSLETLKYKKWKDDTKQNFIIMTREESDEKFFPLELGLLFAHNLLA